MTPMLKTYLSLFLPALALFEFWTAMSLFGKKEHSHNTRTLLRLHRIFGYVFLLSFLAVCWIGVYFITRLNYSGSLNMPRVFMHILLALILFPLLLLKIVFIRFYRNYRPYVPLLGILICVGTLVLWSISGWLYMLIR